MNIDVIVTDQPDAAAVALISERLDQFNIELSGITDHTPLAVLVTDPDSGEVLGGLIGRTSLGVLFVELFFLPESLRGDDLGMRLLKAAEDEARRRGCRHGVLYTISFQAPGFYVKQGWEIFGEVPCNPPGTSRVFLRKDLSIG